MRLHKETECQQRMVDHGRRTGEEGRETSADGVWIVSSNGVGRFLVLEL
jgi:hypothetical protein